MKKQANYEIENDPSITEARKRRGRIVNTTHFILDPKYLNLGVNKKYLLKTYGCQGNLADSENIAGILELMGFEEAFEETDADLIIFNTCAIRENAEERVFGEIGRIEKFRKKNPDLLIGLCGCMAQEEKTIEKIKKTFPYINIVFGTHNIASLPELVHSALIENQNRIEVLSIEGDLFEDLPVKRESKYKAWVNIMFGCDEFCTYCIVPYTRGKERSRRPDDIIKEVKDLASKGYKEVTLLGQNVNAYGKDFLDIDYTFGDLLRDLHEINIPRIRFTTSHPRDLDDKTIEAMALGGNIMPHLHLPVQSGNNEVLKKMNRKYTREEYLDKVNKLKTLIPGISITTDIIVAFPTETLEAFKDTLSLVEEVEFEGAYTFIYSPRVGTPAASYPNPLTEDEKKDRLLVLNDLINSYFLKGRKRFENTIVEVLVDGPSKNNPKMYTGYTKHNMLVNFEPKNVKEGDIVQVKILKAFSWHMLGELV